MSAKDLAERMGKSVRYVQMLAAEGKIRWTMKDGKSKLYDSDSVPPELPSNCFRWIFFAFCFLRAPSTLSITLYEPSSS